MTKEERIKALNESEHFRSPFNTAEELAKANEEQLTKLETFVAAEAKKDVDDAAKKQDDNAKKQSVRTEDSINEKPAPKGDENRSAAAPMTAEQWLAAAPQEIRDLAERQKASDVATRVRLVGQLKVAQKEYSESELTAMPIKDLERIAKIAKVEAPVDYGGMGFPRAAASAEDVFSNPPDGYALALARDNKAAN